MSRFRRRWPSPIVSCEYKAIRQRLRYGRLSWEKVEARKRAHAEVPFGVFRTEEAEMGEVSEVGIDASSINRTFLLSMNED